MQLEELPPPPRARPGEDSERNGCEGRGLARARRGLNGEMVGDQ